MQICIFSYCFLRKKINKKEYSKSTFLFKSLYNKFLKVFTHSMKYGLIQKRYFHEEYTSLYSDNRISRFCG